MKSAVVFLNIFLFLAIFQSYSQDKIVLISGKTIEGKVLSVNEDTIKFQQPGKGKVQEGFVESYRVFSIQYAGGKEEVIYKYDSLTVNDRTEEELRNFIAGEQDALRGYKPAFAAVLSFGISGAAAFLMNGSFIIIVVPFVTYMAMTLLYKTNIDKNTVRNPQLISNPDYIEGYKRIAKSKKNRNALWGSIIGAGLGYGVYVLSQSESNF
jgi:preprotein translocase subunit SecG